MTLDRFKRWLDLNFDSEKTKKNYFDSVNKFFKSFNKVSTKTVEDYVLHLKEQKRSSATINLFLNAMRNYCKALEVDIDLPKSAKVKVNKGDTDPFFTVNELEEIIKYLPLWYPNDYSERTFVLKMMFYTGARPSALLNLKKDDIDFKNEEIIFRGDKGNKDRYVPFLNNELTQELTRRVNSDEKLINMTYSKMNYMFRKIKKELNLQGRIEPRTMRRSFGYFCVEKGFSESMLQRMFGHKKIETTQVYFEPTKSMIHTKAKEIRDESKKIN